MQPMKVLAYRGGLVRFRIPADWIEEYDEDGGGTFYEDRPESGTLRLNVLTFASSHPLGSAAAVDALLPRGAKYSAAPELLPDGNALIRYGVTALEDGQPIYIEWWEVANPVPPKHLRIALFSFTILEEQRTQSAFADAIEAIDGEVRCAEFSPELGIASG